MPTLKFKPKRFTSEAIDSSSEIQSWLTQFPANRVYLAKAMLRALYFFSHDDYASWLQTAISSLPLSSRYAALYAVRKLDDDGDDEDRENHDISFWKEDGSAVPRPGRTQGSEDFVHSLIANIVRGDETRFLDHPDLTALKKYQIRDIVLVDDSINSGHRVCEFITAMQAHPTFLSMWSYGWLRLHILAFARSRESELTIINGIHGSNHPSRKHPTYSKVNFYSDLVYNRAFLKTRWGIHAKEIAELCRSLTQIPNRYRLGYGQTMSNIVFYHSVPNNLPAPLWYSKPNKWADLLTKRTLPKWAIDLLGGRYHQAIKPKTRHFDDPAIVALLQLIATGNRRSDTIALKLNCEVEFAKRLIALAQQLKLISERNYLTTQGRTVLIRLKQEPHIPNYDRSLYIPNSWCND